MSEEYFPKISPIQFEGRSSTNPLSYRIYDPKKEILGKTMQEHLRIAVCFWHNFCWQGMDTFGGNTFDRPWLNGSSPMDVAKKRIQAGFEFFEKLGTPYFCFHDRDIAPEGKSMQESIDNLNRIGDLIEKEMQTSGLKLLWGTANLFGHPRFMAGASTNPNAEVFAFACAQVKAAMDLTHRLGGENYVFWGGREGYETLLNTDLKAETEHFARFLHMAAEYKHKIGFTGTLLIEPKPCEPTTHQYDYDCATVYAFLQKHGLEKEFKVNIEANHATLAGHSFHHEVCYALSNGIFGSIDANQGNPQLGWDTDEYPKDLFEYTKVMYSLLKHGGFTSGGFNFDTKLRRQSIDLEDLFYAHIQGIDLLAHALEKAEKIISDGFLDRTLEKRYESWNEPLGNEIMHGKYDFESLSEYVLKEKLDPKPLSGEQEKLELLFQRFFE